MSNIKTALPTELLSSFKEQIAEVKITHLEGTISILEKELVAEEMMFCAIAGKIELQEIIIDEYNSRVEQLTELIKRAKERTNNLKQHYIDNIAKYPDVDFDQLINQYLPLLPNPNEENNNSIEVVEDLTPSCEAPEIDENIIHNLEKSYEISNNKNDDNNLREEWISYFGDIPYIVSYSKTRADKHCGSNLFSKLKNHLDTLDSDSYIEALDYLLDEKFKKYIYVNYRKELMKDKTAFIELQNKVSIPKDELPF